MSDDHVGKVALVAASGGPLRLVSIDLAGDVGLCRRVASDLGDVHVVEDGVHGPVAAEVEPVSSGWSVALSGRHGDGGRSTPPSKLCFGGESAGVADLD